MAQFKFTDRDLKLITKSLPPRVNARRCKLLPRILDDWCRHELPEHLFLESAADLRNRVKRLGAVRKCAEELSRQLDMIEKADYRFWIVRELAKLTGSVDRQERRFAQGRRFLTDLAAAADRAVTVWKRGPGQPRNIGADLVLRDIAAIFEWLTGKKGTRQVSREDYSDVGPLWEFAAAIWSVVFGSGDDGLHQAMKRAAAAEKTWRTNKKGRERSPLLYNVELRHPE
jgi:hypothetical protein